MICIDALNAISFSLTTAFRCLDITVLICVVLIFRLDSLLDRVNRLQVFL